MARIHHNHTCPSCGYPRQGETCPECGAALDTEAHPDPDLQSDSDLSVDPLMLKGLLLFAGLCGYATVGLDIASHGLAMLRTPIDVFILVSSTLALCLLVADLGALSRNAPWLHALVMFAAIVLTTLLGFAISARWLQ